jgi:hypothetical protein
VIESRAEGVQRGIAMKTKAGEHNTKARFLTMAAFAFAGTDQELDGGLRFSLPSVRKSRLPA